MLFCFEFVLHAFGFPWLYSSMILVVSFHLDDRFTVSHRVLYTFDVNEAGSCLLHIRMPFN